MLRNPLVRGARMVSNNDIVRDLNSNVKRMFPKAMGTVSFLTQDRKVCVKTSGSTVLIDYRLSEEGNDHVAVVDYTNASPESTEFFRALVQRRGRWLDDMSSPMDFTDPEHGPLS